mgnify:CR=1 FL=1
MTHFERLFAALWVSEQWFVAAQYKPPRQALHYRTRGIVVFDRVLNHKEPQDGR